MKIKRLQGATGLPMTRADAAKELNVSAKTIQRQGGLAGLLLAERAKNAMLMERIAGLEKLIVQIATTREPGGAA